MKDNKRACLILERWQAELASKDRSRSSLAANFEELFYDLYSANIPLEVAHDLLKVATAHHFPSHSVAKFTYKNVKRDPNQTFAEFLDGWKQLITNEATVAFNSFYSVEGENTKKEEKKHGSMSAQEYMKQRKYADSFVTIDTDALQEKIDEMLEEDSDE